MGIPTKDPRWKTAEKTARSSLTKEQIIERLFKSADRIYSDRVELRKDSEILQDAYDDATGLVTHDMYGNALVKETKDKLYQLDHMIGDVARQMEFLARELKKGGK